MKEEYAAEGAFELTVPTGETAEGAIRYVASQTSAFELIGTINEEEKT
ncbi:hypothetical protein KP78_17060 [Jeotgalibacillus soli]|uniref:Uncharacterized protein n=2 Tax=Jeotgalibacillus soli TaxID=889306 RepID=A0A0C2S2L1_9BACL|nr:hypothetical protein KP78_17060 [Jeotgalibacillus soli]